ncbi:MAG TPA: Rrf2 family transcriptional regulator [Bacteroidales bacterium]|nr:Rrf2 family transcriptional regulator [Bacteroidales bacterium]
MLSNSCRYGIRAVIYLANQPSNAVKTGIRQIAEDLDLPTPFLAKILQELVKQNILLSSKGPHGGFSLLKEPKKIRIIDIVRAIDGDEYLRDCVMHSSPCGGKKKNKKYCSLHDDYEKIRTELIDLFGKRTIHDLVVRSGKSKLISI